jgi:E3 ubiquitin-protein ligase HUWE1
LLTQCPFKDPSFIDKIRQCTIEFSLDPPDYEDAKNTIVQAIQALEDVSTEENVAFEIRELLVSASTIYTKELWELFKPKFEKIRTTGDFPNKSHIAFIFISVFYQIASLEGYPQEKEFLDFYEICYNETIKVSPDFTQTVELYGCKIQAESLLGIAIFTRKLNEETIMPFIPALFTPNFTKIGHTLFKNESAELFVKSAPVAAFSLANILSLGEEKALYIINNANVEFLNQLFNLESYSNIKYEIMLAIFNRCIKSVLVDRALEMLNFIHIEDITKEIIDLLADCSFVLPNSVLSQITDFSIVPSLLPVIDSLNFVPEAEITKLLTETKDKAQLYRIIELCPSSPVLSNVDFWINLAKEIKEDEWKFGQAIVSNLPDINDHVTRFIKELEPNIAMVVLNSILKEKFQCFMAFIEKPEYIELLHATDLPITQSISRDLDLSSLKFKTLNEETPAPIWLLYASSDYHGYSFTQPVLPTLSEEEIKSFIEIKSKVRMKNSPFERQNVEFMKVRGKNLMKCVAYSYIIDAAVGKKLIYKGLNDTNKLVFISSSISNPKKMTIKHLSRGKLFEETDEPLLSFLRISADMDETTTLLMLYILRDLAIKSRSDPSAYPISSALIIEMYKGKHFEKSKAIELLMASVVSHIFSAVGSSNMPINAICNEYYESIITCLYESYERCPELFACLIKNKKIKEFIDKKAETDKKFSSYVSMNTHIGQIIAARNYPQEQVEETKEEEETKEDTSDTIDPIKIKKQATRLTTDVLRQVFPLEKVLKIISDIPSTDVGAVENLLMALLRDDETNPHYIQFMLGKTYNKFVNSISFLGNTFFNFFNRPEALAKAVDSLYVHNTVRPDILFQRVKPLDLPPPSAFTTELIGGILNLCKEKMSFNAFEALFFIAQFHLPLFKYVKMPMRDIFEMCFAAKHDSTDFSPVFAATAFLDNLLEQPQFTDEFFEWVFEKIESFEELQILMATTMINMKIKRPKTSVLSVAVLMKNNWPAIAAQLLEKEYTAAKDTIINNIISATTAFYTAINNMTPGSALVYQSLLEGEKIFSTKFGYLPMESMFRSFRMINPPLCLIDIPFYSNNVTAQLFSYRPKIQSSESRANAEKLKQILTSHQSTPEVITDPLPESVNEEAYQNLSEIHKASVLQRVIFLFNITPEFVKLAVREEPWVLSVLKNKPHLLVMPSHYLRINRLIKESEQLEKIEEPPTQETVALEFYLQPEIIDAISKIPLNKTKNLIKEMLKNPIMSETLLTNAIENIETATRDQIIACIDIIGLMSDSESSKELIATAIPNIIEFTLGSRSTKEKKLMNQVCNILIKTGVFPEKVGQLIGFCLLSSSSNAALQIYAKLPPEQKSSCGFIIEGAFRMALKNEKIGSLLNIIKNCPEITKAHSSELLKFVDTYLQRSANKKAELVGAILSVLAPEPGSLSVTSISIEANVTDTNTLPIPSAIIAQNPDFWNMMQKNISTIRSIITLNPELLNKSFSFMQRFPMLIPFEQRVNAFRNRVRSLLNNNNLSIKVDRKRILEDTFFNIGMSPPSKILGKIRVSYANEKGCDAGGVLRSWFTDVIKEAFNPDYLLFQATSNGLSYQANYESSVNPNEHLKYFKMIGRIIARAVIEGVAVPAHFTQGILKCILGHSLTLKDLEAVDENLFNSLTFLRDNDAEECYLTFERTVKGLGYNYSIKLKKDGDKIDVTNENKEEYIQLMINNILYQQTKAQIDALVTGFHDIIPKEELRSFNSRELNLIICGLPQISIDDLEANTNIMAPYSRSSPTIKALFNVLRRWDNEHRSLFLFFVTSSSNVPVGGFGMMEHKFTIQRLNDARRLPVAHTCFNVIELPDYKDEKLLEEKLLFAIKNTGTFELS